MGIFWSFNLALGELFDFLISPFSKLAPIWGLAVVSLVTGAIMVLIFKLVSNQTEIKRTKARLRAYLLEIWLYKHEFVSFLGTIGRIFRTNLTYMKFAVSPMLVMIFPVILIMVHLNLNYSFRPFRPGETALMTVKFANSAVLRDTTLSATVAEGIIIDGAPMRAVGKNEATWRIKAAKAGEYDIVVKWKNGQVAKKVLIGKGSVVRLSPKRSHAGSIVDALGNPGEKPIPSTVGVEWIKIGYPEREVRMLGMKIHWIIIFFILSVVAGFALKGVFKVEI